jgi:peptidyl-prolyl cis-trans isomerase C
MMAEIRVPTAQTIDTDLFGDKVVVTGKGIEIKQSGIDELYTSFVASRAAAGQRVPDSLRPKIEGEIIERLIATQLLLGLATDGDRTIGKETARKLIDEQIKASSSPQAFHRQLRASGNTPEKHEAQLVEQATVKAVIDRELRSKKSVSDEQIRKFYEENSAEFLEPETARVRHILLATRDPATGRILSAAEKVAKRELAGDLLIRIRSGQDFVKLMGEYSEDTKAKVNEGEYSVVRAKEDPRQSVPIEFEAAAFSLKPGQVSEIVETQFGYHILKLIEIVPPKKRALAKVEERIREALLQEATQKEIPGFLDRLKKQAGVQIHAR